MGLLILVLVVGALFGFGGGFLFAVLLHDYLSRNPDEIDQRRQ